MLPLPLRHPACYGLGCMPPGALLPAPKGMPVRPRKHATALAAACMPRPWLLRARPSLGCCMPMPWLLSAHGGLPWPWLLHAHALAACPWGLPWPWLLHAHALAACPWGVALALAAARLGQEISRIQL